MNFLYVISFGLFLFQRHTKVNTLMMKKKLHYETLSITDDGLTTVKPSIKTA